LKESFPGERPEHHMEKTRVEYPKVRARVRTGVLPRGTPSSPDRRWEAPGFGIGDGRSEFGLKLHFGFWMIGER